MKLPVVAICSKVRHDIKHARDENADGMWNKSIDIHTSEAPITITEINIDKTIAQLCLADLAINGVIDLFVVERTTSPGGTEEEPGKDAIFINQEAWVSQVYFWSVLSDNGTPFLNSHSRKLKLTSPT